MPISAPTRAGDKPVCAEPENLALVDRAHEARGRFAYKLREQMFEDLCAGCPLIETCGEFARTNGEHGLWGGTSERQRRAQGHRHSYSHNILGAHGNYGVPAASSAGVAS